MKKGNAWEEWTCPLLAGVPIPLNDIIQLSGGWKVAKPFISVSEPIGLVSKRTDTSLTLLALRLSLPDFGQSPSRYAYRIFVSLAGCFL